MVRNKRKQPLFYNLTNPHRTETGQNLRHMHVDSSITHR